jgi:hypothetical protein
VKLAGSAGALTRFLRARGRGVVVAAAHCPSLLPLDMFFVAAAVKAVQ